MKYSFFSGFVSALLALCLALPSSALAANQTMDHNFDGKVDVLDVFQVLLCVVGAGGCSTAATCDWTTETWNGSACVATVEVPDGSTYCGTDTSWDGSACVSSVEVGLNCWVAGFCNEANEGWSTGEPIAAYGPASLPACLDDGQLDAWQDGEAKAKNPSAAFKNFPKNFFAGLCAAP